MQTTLTAPALLLVSSVAIAAPPPEQAPPDPAQVELAEPEADQPERKVCRTTKVTGSLTRRSRVCLTETEWREVHDRTRKGLDEFIGGASGGCRAPNDPRAGSMCGG